MTHLEADERGLRCLAEVGDDRGERIVGERCHEATAAPPFQVCADGGAPASHGPVGDALARKLRHGRLDALETGFTRWAQRRHDGAARAARSNGIGYAASTRAE